MFGGSQSPGAPVGIRIQRRVSHEHQPVGPPPTLPPESSCSSSSDEEPQREGIRIAALKPSPASQPPSHPPLTEKTSYVEEPPSVNTTLERKEKKMEKERALVRRITNDMQVAHFVTKMDHTPLAQRGAFSTGVYRIRGFRFVESSLRYFFWHLGKAIANHQFIFMLVSIIIVGSSLISPLIYADKLRITLPFAQLFDHEAVISNSYGIQRTGQDFNFTNPAFTTLDRMDQHTFAVLMQTRTPKDSILRRDAVMAYSALKKKLDDYPTGHKEYLELCNLDCEVERDMVDRIIKKSSQVALTFPETFVSMSKDATNLSRAYLGSNIGGVDTDSDGAVDRAQSLLMTFKLRPDLSLEQKQTWKANFDDQVLHTGAANVSFFPWSPAAFQAAIIYSLQSAHRWLVVSAVFLVVICLFSSFGVNSYQSKPMVGVQIGVTLLVSCAGGLFVQLIGASVLDPLVWPVFFIVTAVGLIWLFQLHLGWSRFTNAAVHPTEKMAFILAHDGPGIAIGAFVVILTYVTLGILASNAHMSAVFTVLAASLVFLVTLVFIFVTVFVYRGGRREAKGVKWYQLFKTGDTHFTAPNMTDFDSHSLFALHDRLIDSRPSVPRSLAAYLVAPRIRYPIVFFCTAYLIFASWGCYNIRVDLKEEHFLPSQSEGAQFIRQYREMFGKSTQFLEVVIDQAVEYHEHEVSSAINEILDSAVMEGYATRSVSWLSEFEKFERSSVYDINPDTFVPVVNLVFMSTEPYKRFAADLTFDRFQTQITKSRMYLELTEKGVNKREALSQMLLRKATAANIPMSVRIPFTISLKHDVETISSVLTILAVALALLAVFSFICFGQPGLVILLIFSSAAVIMESVGYAVLWQVPINIVTFTMILAGNALTCVIAMAFCYSYSVSGKNQMRAVARIQYSLQATLFPVLLACLVPVVTYIPLLLLDTPVVSHIWKVLLINSAACLIHYLFFLPNLMLLFSEHIPSCRYTSCQDLCCEMEDDNSIYYFPTTGRTVHPADGMYRHASYTYSIPQQIQPSPPNYLAIEGSQHPPMNTPGYLVDYGTTESASRKSRRQRRHSGSSTERGTPRVEARRVRRKYSRDDSIYEAPPSPPRITSRNASPRQIRSTRDRPPAMLENQWRPYISQQQQPQPYFYPQYQYQRR